MDLNAIRPAPLRGAALRRPSASHEGQLGSSPYLLPRCHTAGRRKGHVRRPDGLLSGGRLCATAHVPASCGALSGRQRSAALQVLAAVPGDAVRAAHLSGEPAGHRGLLGRRSGTELPHGLHRAGGSQYPGRRQRGPGLADLRGLRAGVDRGGAAALRRRAARCRTRSHGLRSGLQHDRPHPVAVSVGRLPSDESRGQVAHSARLARKHPDLHLDHRRESARCPCPQCPGSRAGFRLRPRSRVCRLRAPVAPSGSPRHLRHPGEEGASLPAALLQAVRPLDGHRLRPDDRSDRPADPQALPAPSTANPVPRPGLEQVPRLPHERSGPSCPEHRSALPQPLAGRALLQVDQATPPHQGVLWHLGQRREDPNLDCHLRLRPGRDCTQAPKDRARPLHYSPDPERVPLRESPAVSTTYGHDRFNRARRSAQTAEVLLHLPWTDLEPGVRAAWFGVPSRGPWSSELVAA